MAMQDRESLQVIAVAAAIVEEVEDGRSQSPRET